MNITEVLSFALLGAEWVLWLLIALSVLSVAVMIERVIFLVRNGGVNTDQLIKDARAALRSGQTRLAQWENDESIEAAVAMAGVREAPRGAASAAEAMVAARSQKRAQYDRNLAFLGTLGNNAPFIGLFGTVLGIIKAFNDLAENSQTGAQAVMSGVSQSLVATAVGLMVAIPAVLGFNFLNRRVRTVVGRSDAVAHLILTELRADPSTRSTEEAA